ncbi:MAG: hypothetical protein IJ511_05265 [Bacteroides sp.]|nr:hypothetical protein [Bacteroides sp.]
MKRQLYILKYFVLYALLAALLTGWSSCSDEEIIKMPGDEPQAMMLKLHVPEMEQVSMTRAVDENGIGQIHVRFLKGTTVYSNQNYTPDTNGTVKLFLPKGVDGLQVVANYNGTLPDDLATATVNGLPITEGQLPMWGKVSSTDNGWDSTNKTITVSLQRAVAKMSIDATQCYNGGSSSTTTNTFSLTQAKIFNVYDRGYLVENITEGGAPVLPSGAVLLGPSTATDAWTSNTLQLPAVTSESETNPATPLYLYPTPCQTAKTRIVIEGRFNGATYYYPVELVETDDKGYVTGTAPTYLNILPNHEYKLVIKDVTGKGYDSPAAALKNPPLNMLVEIIDRRVDIFDMVANGSDELGVGQTVTIEAHAEGYYNAAPAAVETKVFTTYDPTNTSYEGSDFSQMKTPEITYEGNESNWLTVALKDNYASNNDGTAGYMYTYTLTANRNPSTTPRTAKITFKVGLLERTITVEQKGSTVLMALSKRNVWLYSGEKNGIIKNCLITENYFQSLLGGDTSGTVPPIYGTLPEDMQGVSRQGLIFNIIDTEDEFHDNYTYQQDGQDGQDKTEFVSSTLSYFIKKESTDEITLHDGTGDTWTWNVTSNTPIKYNGNDFKESDPTGSEYIGINATYGALGGVFYIYLKQQALTKNANGATSNKELLDYYLNMKNGEMKVVITTTENTRIEIPIYVSGILHNLNGKNQIVPAGESGPVKGWHYYELVKHDSISYIFDRNLGAKSNKRDAQGAYFYKKLKWNWDGSNNKYAGEESILPSILGDAYNEGRLTILNGELSLDFDNDCPYLKSSKTSYNDGFKVYFPLLKYLQGHCWIEGEGVGYDLKLADGYPMGEQGGYYWRGGTDYNEESKIEDYFWWNNYLFNNEGCSLNTFRITEEQGGRTELYYGLQMRLMYTPKEDD